MDARTRYWERLFVLLFPAFQIIRTICNANVLNHCVTYLEQIITSDAHNLYKDITYKKRIAKPGYTDDLKVN